MLKTIWWRLRGRLGALRVEGKGASLKWATASLPIWICFRDFRGPSISHLDHSSSNVHAACKFTNQYIEFQHLHAHVESLESIICFQLACTSIPFKIDLKQTQTYIIIVCSIYARPVVKNQINLGSQYPCCQFRPGQVKPDASDQQEHFATRGPENFEGSCNWHGSIGWVKGVDSSTHALLTLIKFWQTYIMMQWYIRLIFWQTYIRAMYAMVHAFMSHIDKSISKRKPLQTWLHPSVRFEVFCSEHTCSPGPWVFLGNHADSDSKHGTDRIQSDFFGSSKSHSTKTVKSNGHASLSLHELNDWCIGQTCGSIICMQTKSKDIHPRW
jgi:hypothetical protein